MTPSELALPPRGATLAARYTAFAAFATVVNLLVQAGVLQLYLGPLHLWLAMACGTLAGLVPKYVLDKHWIFADRSSGIDIHARKFTLYTLLSVVTTLIFWATEWLFDHIGHGGLLRYVGAVIGLALGYWTKYHLDRRLVFGSVP